MTNWRGAILQFFQAFPFGFQPDTFQTTPPVLRKSLPVWGLGLGQRWGRRGARWQWWWWDRRQAASVMVSGWWTWGWACCRTSPLRGWRGGRGNPRPAGAAGVCQQSSGRKCWRENQRERWRPAVSQYLPVKKNVRLKKTRSLVAKTLKQRRKITCIFLSDSSLVIYQESLALFVFLIFLSTKFVWMKSEICGK